MLKMKNKWDLIIYALYRNPKISFQTVRYAEQIRRAVERTNRVASMYIVRNRRKLIKCVLKSEKNDKKFFEFIKDIIWNIRYSHYCMDAEYNCSRCSLPEKFEEVFGKRFKCFDSESPLHQLEDLIKKDLNKQ